MLLRIICIGKTGKKFLEEGEKEYLNRLVKYVPSEIIVLPDVKNAKSLSEAQIKDAESKLFFQKIGEAETVFLLDERGKQHSSTEFSVFLQDQFNRGGKAVNFLIGGPYGFDDKIYRRANGLISLSKMTFSHQMVRMFFLEQLYRGMTILKGEPYHHQ